MRTPAALVVVVLGALLTGCAPEPAPTTPVSTACGADAIVIGPEADELQAALDAALPGDVLALSETRYVGAFTVTRSGTAEAPVTLCGTAGAVIDGGGTGSGYGLHLDGADHWHLTGFTVTNAAKGIVLDASDFNTLEALTVTGVGDEAIHLRTHSSDNTITGTTIARTGLVQPDFGEGIYVGSAVSNWCRYTDCAPDASDRNTIVGNDISGVTAEAIDVKEGTTAGVVQGNTLASAATDTPAIGLKGNEWQILENRMMAADADGLAVFVIEEGWGQRNVIGGNTFTVGGDWLAVRFTGAARTTGNLLRCDNSTDAGTPARSNVPCE